MAAAALFLPADRRGAQDRVVGGEGAVEVQAALAEHPTFYAGHRQAPMALQPS